MIEVEKVYTDNPFVDETIYYGKLLAINSVVKDQEKALNAETPESLHAGDTYIACKENRAIYEMFDSIPEEILEKYIMAKSNIDIMVEDNNSVAAYMQSLSLHDRTEFFERISELARTIYMDHYNVMMKYVSEVQPTWISDYAELYNKCKNKTATYKDLFDVMPIVTVKRILSTYVDNYDNRDDMDTVFSSLPAFSQYVSERDDPAMVESIKKINLAMCTCFESHYDMMVQRNYIQENNKNWYKYTHFDAIMKRCESNAATYRELYPLMPSEDIREVLVKIINEDTVNQFQLDTSIDNLIQYLEYTSTNKEYERKTIESEFRNLYIRNYNMCLNFDTYNNCRRKTVNYYDLTQFIPKETLKLILNTEVTEVSNITVYSESKNMLNYYLNTLSKEARDKIKQSITSDMQIYYVNNYVEKNAYYRTLIGLPPLDENGDPYLDTLVSTYDEKTGITTSFGDKFINMIPEGINPEIHWKNTPICEFDDYDIGILNEYGVLDEYIYECGGTSNSRYKYLKYLGSDALDIYTCRKADNFDLIYVPNINSDAMKKKFIDKYLLNRDYIMHTVYDEAYKFGSDHYNAFIICLIMVSTIMDMVSDIPDMIIHKDIFDSRSIKYLFESSGIPYYSEIPIKYQQAMLKNLNVLIKYKSSTKNMVDICSLFGFNDIKVFEYYMLKTRNTDINTGNYLFKENNEISYPLDQLYVVDPSNGKETDFNGIKYTKLLAYRGYNKDRYTKTISVMGSDGNIEQRTIIKNDVDCYIKDPENNVFIPLKETDYFKNNQQEEDLSLKFIKVPINESLSDYKKDNNYAVSYEETISGDDTWNGSESQEKVKQAILDYEFNAVSTKYISIETVTEMTNLAYQVSYFYNMLFDNLYSEEALTVKIPYIKQGHNFKFMDVLCYLFSLMYIYNNLNDNIMYSPTQILYVKGYNFNTDLNKVLQDSTAFTQTKDPMKQENIFDINEQIATNSYDYQQAFSNYNIQSFNLNADLDELDAWLSQYQLSLDDFIVDDTLTKFDHVITLRNFYSLNNSYYQKNIFTNNLLPTAYNQNIKYAFNSELYKKNYVNNIDDIPMEYITEVINGQNFTDLVISDVSDSIYVIDTYKYIIDKDGYNHVAYHKYNKTVSGYDLDDVDYYIMTSDKKYVPIISGSIYVKKDNDYIMAADAYYKLEEDGSYTELTNPDLFYTDYNNKKILNIGDYYVQQDDGTYVLNPENCYILATRNGQSSYILLKDASEYDRVEVAASKCYVRDEDGHFISLLDTDYYDRNDDGTYTYDPKICYIVSNKHTDYYDETAEPIVYYEKLTDYYDETDFTLIKDQCYVKNSDGKYLKEQDIISPNNCYIKDTASGEYKLVKNLYVTYDNYIYDQRPNMDYVLVLQKDNNYSKCKLIGANYDLVVDSSRTYVKSSESTYLLVLRNNENYDQTHEMVVVLNKDINKQDTIISSTKYNPEDDNKWDENDWFYSDDPSDPNCTTGISGENNWFYKDENGNDDVVIEPTESAIGSGFYLTSDKYLGYNKIEPGKKYYLAMDIETNFTGEIQIGCEADQEVVDSTNNKIFKFTSGINKHIDEEFVANNNQYPRLVFYIYNYKERPITNGDYIIVRNIRFIKAYSDAYIAQDIPSYDKLQDLYGTNEAIYKYLVTQMNECGDLYTYNIYKKLYDSLMVSKYNKEAFKLSDGTYAKTYTDFLQTRDSVLYERLTYFKSLDTETMQKEIADNIIEVTYAINDVIDTYSYAYLYSYFPAVSATYIQQYISKIINFFKSWKVHLLGINTVYKFDNQLENTIKILENKESKAKILQDKYVHINDSLKINPIDDVNPSNIPYRDYCDYLFENSDGFLYTRKLEDKSDIKDHISIIEKTDNGITYKENNAIIHLNRDDIKVEIDENGHLIVSDGDITIQEPNSLLLLSNDGEEDWFGAIVNQAKGVKSTNI